MASLVEIHMLVPYGFNSINRDENGKVKSGNFAGREVVRISSQSKKVAIRKAFGNTYHTRELGNKLLEDYKNIHFEASEERIEEIKKLIDLLHLNTSEVAQYSKAEKDAILNFIESLDSDFLKKINSLDKEKDKQKLEKEGKILLEKISLELAKASLSDEIAVFGRMSTTALGETVPSAVHMNHMMSIDSYMGEYDYFTTFDNVANQSAMIGLNSFSGNLMYGYSNIDPIQIYENLMKQSNALDLKEEDLEIKKEQCVKRAIESTIKFIEEYIKTHPEGKQNSMASFPLPIMVYLTFGNNVFPCTAENAFVKPIYANHKCLSEQASERLFKFITEDAFPQNYQNKIILRDSNLKESGKLENFNDVRGIGEIDTVLTDSIKVSLIELFDNYLNN